MQCAFSMGFLALADRIMWPKSLSREVTRRNYMHACTAGRW